MKTKIYLGLSITAVTLIMACNSNTTSKQESLLTDSVSHNPTEINEELKSKYIIPVADIKEMVAKYKQERIETMGSSALLKGYGPEFKDSRCVWFSIEELKEFIKAAESQPVKADGIRMYYTVYPEKKDGESSYLNAVPAESRNHTTLVLVPTYYDDKTQSHPDFQPLPTQENVQGSSQGGEAGAARAASAAQSVMGLNHGGLCPPNCPSAGAGSTFLND